MGVDDLEMRSILAQLELVSHGRTQTIDANRVHGSKDPSSILRLDEEAYPHEFWRAEWVAAGDDHDSQQEALEGARNALQAIRLGAPLPDDFLEPGSFRWKCAIADDDRPVAELARLHSIARQTVKAYRERYRGVARRSYEKEQAA